MEAKTADTRLDASRLESLLESARVLGSSLDLREQLNHLMRTVMGRLLVTRALIALRDGPGGWRVAAVRGVRGIREGDTVDPESLAELGLELRIPIGEGAREAGFLAVPMPKRPGWAEDQGEREFLQALLSLASATIENALAHEEIVEANRALAQKIHELNTLVDLARAFSASIDPEEIARLLMLTLSGRWTVRQHALLAWAPGQQPLKLARNVSEEQMERWRRSAPPKEPERDGEFLLVPLRSGDAVAGVVALGPPASGGGYAQEDVEFCAALVAQASVALDNAWRIQDTLYRRQMERELELASAIQKDLFPKRMPQVPGLELAAANRQARLVGGDYYDVLGGAESPVLCVADVAGKGLSAALLMATIQATLRALLSFPLGVRELADRANELLCGSMPGNRYATLFLARYDAAGGEIEYVNAAQCQAILLRAGGEIELLDATGLPIGMFPGLQYESRRFDLAPGDALVIYSDGVTDAQAPSEEEFGLERLCGTIRRLAGATAEEMCAGVIEAVSRFVEETPQYDDITVMVARRVSEAG